MSLVECKAGKFEGILHDSCHQFYGIPYAKYEQRWDESILIENELNLRVIEKGDSAPQTRVIDQSQSGISFFQDNSLSKQSEDCLTLNICSNDIKAKNPVMIWIHGGALVTGGSSSIMYELKHLAKRGVVVVSINYRLGPLGFLRLGEVTNNQINSSGNEGLIDQRNAIKWVKDNISSFGGDPNNITIFGESAGSWSCNLQIAAGHDKLFQKAICQSGGLDAIATKEKANQWAELFTDQFKKDGHKLSDLRSCDWESITNTAKKLKHSRLSDGKRWIFPEVGFLPVIDNKFIKDDYLKTHSSSSIHLIAGTTLDEYKLWSTFHPRIGKNDEEYITRRLSKMFESSKLSEVISAYREYLKISELGDIYSAILTDICFGIPTHNTLQKKEGNSFGYLFSTQSEILRGKLGCFHASELPYVFGVHSKKPYSSWGPKESQEISDNFQIPWTNFSKTNDPSFGDFSWNNYNDSFELALIGNKVRALRNPFLERYELIEKYKIF
ncbi:carboxylesterase family protein [Pseudomonadota bacterium]|nr:carboxylesterase family protein [Pseudomonadota bacterium]